MNPQSKFQSPGHFLAISVVALGHCFCVRREEPMWGRGMWFPEVKATFVVLCWVPTLTVMKGSALLTASHPALTFRGSQGHRCVSLQGHLSELPSFWVYAEKGLIESSLEAMNPQKCFLALWYVYFSRENSDMGQISFLLLNFKSYAVDCCHLPVTKLPLCLSQFFQRGGV